MAAGGGGARGFRLGGQLRTARDLLAQQVEAPHAGLILHTVIIKWFEKVTPPTTSSTYCLPLLIKTIRLQICGGVDFLELFV